jgi:hypothetical protein
MLSGSPIRAAHRATADGGLAVLVKPVGTAGQHRPPSSKPRTGTRAHTRRRARREPQRAVQFLTKGLAALIVLGVTGMIGFLIFADERRGRSAEASTTPDSSEALGSRAADPAPLTLEEVFPDAAEVRPAGVPAPYLITMTHIDSECRIATTGVLGRMLEDHGCSQVVRAGLTSPYPDYEVTAGLFNLTDATGAAEVDSAVRGLVETGDGSFAAMAAGVPGADPTAPATSQVGWHARGHYLLYCVITRPDGQVVSGDDPYAARITADLVDGYLGDSVLAKRSSGA